MIEGRWVICDGEDIERIITRMGVECPECSKSVVEKTECVLLISRCLSL